MPQDDIKAQVAEEVGVITDDSQSLEQLIAENRLLPENAIPIPDAMKDIVSQRVDDGKSVYESVHTDWTKSIKEYAETGTYNQRDNDANVPQESLVRTTVETLVDHSYMTNPDITLSSITEEQDGLADLLTVAVKTLFDKKARPGLNMKAKARKNVIYSHLSNYGVFKLTFQEKIGSLQAAQAVYTKVQEQIRKEKDPEKLKRLYQVFDQAHKSFQDRIEQGLSLDVLNPFNLIVDPKCSMADLSDADWTIEYVDFDTAFIKAEYMNYDEEQGTYKFVYNPEVVFSEGDDDSQVKSEAETKMAVLQEIMPDLDEEHVKVLMKDKTRCFYMHDRVARKIFLYIAGQHETPLWVFEDDTMLSRFFPYFILPFSTPLNAVAQKSEVSRYINFQDEINDTKEQMSIIRNVAARVSLFDSQAIDSKEIDKVLKAVMTRSTKFEAIGIKMKDGERSLDQALVPFKMPIANFGEVFDTSDLYNAVQRIARTNEVLQGRQFRTNTTNDAVDSYENFAQARMEGITDSIEEVIEDISWAICEIIVSKFEISDLEKLVPRKLLTGFRNMSVNEFNQNYNLKIAAGSTEKPTSRNKKKEAITVIQMLGQFGANAPGTTLRIVTDMLRTAFNRTIVPDEALDMLKQESEAYLQKGISAQTKPPQQQQPREGE